MLSRTALACAAAIVLVACQDKPTGGAPDAKPAPSASVSSAPPPREPLKAPERSGGALMRSADGTRLYLADEDHRCVRVLPLPFGDEPSEAVPTAGTAAPAASATPSAKPRPSASASAAPLAAPPPPGSIPKIPLPPSARQKEVPLPGAPAQVLPLDGRVLVTIRDPGLLLILDEAPDEGLKEAARIPLPADAWGLAITPDEKVAVITSAWTHQVTGVDLPARAVLWTVNVAREPRGVVVHPNGKTAYVSHLTSGDLTRIDGIGAPAAKASAVPFPAAPARTPLATPLPGSLGYALVMDESGGRLLAARHALGALEEQAWSGAATIDVLQTGSDKPLLGPRTPGRSIKTAPAFDETRAWVLAHVPEDTWRVRNVSYPELPRPGMVQPRAMIVAHKTQTVWVASEGDDTVGEFPLRVAAPIERAVRVIQVGRSYDDPKIMGYRSGEPGIPGACGAPTGLALSRDERVLYVFCRSSYDVAAVRIAGADGSSRTAEEAQGDVAIARLAADPLDEGASRGRRLFYEARDGHSSDGMGCAGCHPEGRDDGHVWHDVLHPDGRKEASFLASQMLADKTHDGKLGYPRQTPMLVGRVNALGPYGWHAQNPTLLDRLAEGFGRHRWSGEKVDPKSWMTGERVNALVPFLRKGLVPPPQPARDLTEQEKKGKEIFESERTRCSRCHDPATDFTDRIAYPFDKLPSPPGFEDEEDQRWKTPSLRFVGGSPPYLHDGSAPTLEALIAGNRDRMGKTSHLSAEERAALVA